VNRRSLPPQLFQSIFRQLIFILILNVSFTFAVPNISKGGHFGGGIVGALVAVPVSLLRAGQGARRWLAGIGIFGVMVAALTLAYRNLERAPLKDLEGDLKEERQREVDEEAEKNSDAEIAQFNNDIMPNLLTALRPVRRFYNDKVSKLLDDKANPAAIAQMQVDLPKLVEDLETEETKLKKAGPYQSRFVENARRAALDVVIGYRKLFAETEQCLRKECTREEQEKRLKPLDEEVKNAESVWQRFLKPE
jgi:hypothetical protein